MLRLAHAWHARVMADEEMSQEFSHGYRPDHSERLAAYWAEALGGPSLYSDAYGDETSVVRIHSGNGAHEEMDRRAPGPLRWSPGWSHLRRPGPCGTIRLRSREWRGRRNRRRAGHARAGGSGSPSWRAWSGAPAPAVHGHAGRSSHEESRDAWFLLGPRENLLVPHILKIRRKAPPPASGECLIFRTHPGLGPAKPPRPRPKTA